MKILKKSISLIVAFSAIIFCTACANSNEISISTGYMEFQYESKAEHNLEDNGNGTEIDQGNSAGVYFAEPHRFSKENINRFLTYCGDGIVDFKDEEKNTATRYSGNCISGKNFLCIERTEYHPHKVFQYFDQEKCDTYFAYPIYSGEEEYETNAQYNVGWMFTEPRDFSFASADEAEEYVRSALSALGVSEVTLLRTLYIDHNTMEEAGKKLATDPVYAPIGEPQENNGYPIRDDWSEADDAYMFSFSIPVGSAALSPRFEIRETATYIGTQIIVWYSANGIDFLSVDMPWNVCELVREPEEIVDSHVASDIAREKMESILTYQNISYDEPFLEYQYQQEKDRWILFPVWTVKVSYQPKGGTATFYKFISIDAITGNEL